MQRLAISLAIMFAALMSATSFAENQNQQTAKNQNQQVAQYIADQLSSRYPDYTIHVKYNSGVVTLAGELYDTNQVDEALGFVRTLPGVTRVINGMNIVQARTAIQPVSVTQDMRRNVNMTNALPQTQPSQTVAASMPASAAQSPAVSAAVIQRVEPNAITRVRGQADNRSAVPDFSRQAPVTPAPAISETTPPLRVPPTETPAPTPAPVATAAPAIPVPTPIPAPLAPSPAPLAPASYVDDTPVVNETRVVNETAANAPQLPVPQQVAVPQSNGTIETGTYANPYDSQMPLPIGQQVATQGRYDQPNVPNYAWPAYAAPNNVSQVAYPRLYCPEAAPYIGPFYPYPQVPTGWRKVTLEWHDGYWWLDFDDGSAHGPFSPLFRSPNPKHR